MAADQPGNHDRQSDGEWRSVASHVQKAIAPRPEHHQVGLVADRGEEALAGRDGDGKDEVIGNPIDKKLFHFA